MAECCNDNLSKVFCNAYNKYYNTLYTNGEISKKETDNLLVISYLRKLFINPRYIDYRPILIKALRCIADRSCLLDSSELYGRLNIKTVGDKFVTVLMRDIYSVKIEETDPTVPLYVKDIKQSDITNWNSKLSLETDPIFSASPAATITNEDINNWNNPSTSGGLFVINVTYHEGSAESYTIDETWDELILAYTDNQTLVLKYDNNIYLLTHIGSNTLLFTGIDGEGVSLDCFEISTDGYSTYCDHLYATELQERLVSGTNIKTVNNTSLIGSGNVSTETPVVEVSGTTVTQTLSPNIFYKFTGAVTSLTLTLGSEVSGITNIFAFSFTAGQDAPTITLPQSVTIADAPTINNGDYVEFSIMDNKAVAIVWQAQQQNS